MADNKPHKEIWKKLSDFEHKKFFCLLMEACHAVQQYGVVELVETLRYKPEGRGFATRWDWDFSLNCLVRYTMALRHIQPLSEMSRVQLKCDGTR